MPTPDEVFAALKRTFTMPSPDPDGPIELRRSGDEAVFVYRWDGQLYGAPLPLTDTSRRMDWDHPAEDLDDWLEWSTSG